MSFSCTGKVISGRRRRRLLGHVIAQFNAGYRKERPADMPDIAEAAGDGALE